MFPLLYVFNDWAMLLLRFALGSILLAHGWPKFKNLQGTAQWMESAGFKPGKFWAPVVVFVEVVGGMAVLLGLASQLAALLLAGQFAVILIWRVKKGDPFVKGFELDLLMLAGILMVLTQGPGAVSLTELFFLGSF